MDFECRRSRVLIEVDGTQHGFDVNRQRDLVRDENLRRAGYKVLRFSNPEIDRELDTVMEAILAELNSGHAARRADARHPPLSGER